MYGRLVKERPYVIQRFSAGEYVNGDYVEGTPTPVTIRASIQPIKGYKIVQLQTSTGLTTSNWIAIYTRDELRIEKEGLGGHGADKLVYRDELYEIRQLKIHDEGHLDHFVGYAARVELAPTQTYEEPA